jgi:maleate isomerase
MPDVLGYRAKMGVLGPSTNTIVEPDYYMMAPPGVTLHE